MSKLKLPSPAMCVALLALLAALGGTSYAALAITSKQVKNNSLTTRDIKNNTIRGKDVRNGSLLARDFKAGHLPAGAQGPAGPAGQAGPAGAPGPPGATDVVVRRVIRDIQGSGAVEDFAVCNTGEAITGGGWSYISDDNEGTDLPPSGFEVLHDGPANSPTIAASDGAPANQWRVAVRGGNAVDRLVIYALCARP